MIKCSADLSGYPAEGWVGLMVAILITLFGFYPAFAQHEIKTIDGIKVQMAIVKVEDIKRHVKLHHPEMEIGPRDTYHLLIHLEGEKTGKVISNVSVMVNIHNPDGTKVSKALKTMTEDGITDFGNYFDLRDIGNYHIEVLITPDGGEAKKVTFVYERRPWH